MSTRANVIIKDDFGKLYFYRHSDGYPEGALPTLEKYVEKIKSGRIRRDAMQSAGWLILLGYDEYKHHQPDWKVGAYEPCPCITGGIEYLYIIDLSKSEISIEIIEEDFDKY